MAVTSNFQGVVNSVIGAQDFSRSLMTSLNDALQVEQLRMTGQAQTEALLENTQALMKNTAAKAGSGGGASTAGGIAEGLLSKTVGGGLLSPLVSGLIGLFGGGKAETPPPLVVYAPPAAVNYDAGFSRTQGATAPAPYTAAASAPQITVQVQAMDSRSFLDHREEIARAVREAMLNSHALNDVVNDL